MHVQVVTFHLDGLGDEEYRATCDEVAAAFAAIPGLLGKTFIASRGTNTYGGVYFWRDREAMEAYLRSDLWQTVAGDPALSGVVSADFDVLEAPSGVTRGLPTAAAV